MKRQALETSSEARRKPRMAGEEEPEAPAPSLAAASANPNDNPVDNNSDRLQLLLLQHLQAQQAQRNAYHMQMMHILQQTGAGEQQIAMPPQNEVTEMQRLLHGNVTSPPPVEFPSITMSAQPGVSALTTAGFGLSAQNYAGLGQNLPSNLTVYATSLPGNQPPMFTPSTVPSFHQVNSGGRAPGLSLAGAVFPSASAANHASVAARMLPPAAPLRLPGEPNQQTVSSSALEAFLRAQNRHSTVPAPTSADSPRPVPLAPSNCFVMSTPEDKECLSEYQCLLREQIEVFEAGDKDLGTIQGRNKPVEFGQVGVRCKHCTRTPGRRRGAAYYPSKLSGIYQGKLMMQFSRPLWDHLLSWTMPTTGFLRDLRRRLVSRPFHHFVTSVSQYISTILLQLSRTSRRTISSKGRAKTQRKISSSALRFCGIPRRGSQALGRSTGLVLQLSLVSTRTRSSGTSCSASKPAEHLDRLLSRPHPSYPISTRTGAAARLHIA